MNDYFALSLELERHHALFYAVWQLGKPIFTEDVKTAAIKFDRSGSYLQFLFNQEYWNGLDDYTRLFVISHECLHVILNHGVRVADTDNVELCNICLDIVVNHLLVRSFGFDRNKIMDQERFCWIDTVFKGQPVSDDDCFEYYYNLLPKLGTCQGETVDDHGTLPQIEWEGIVGELGETISDDEKESFQDVVSKFVEGESGDTSQKLWAEVGVKKVPVKKKWETIIKEWSKRACEIDAESEQWARTNRRFSMLNSELLLPSEMEYEGDEKKRVEVWFFQDTSGSCYHLIDRFFNAALSLDHRRFDVKMLCFDIDVYEINLPESKVYGLGGTGFNCIEEFIQRRISVKNIVYPKAVFILTDGYGNVVTPQYPQRWHWFLSTDYIKFIPKQSYRYKLEDFE